MKKSISEVIQGLQSELESLITKINALERFIISKDFQEITGKQKTFLAQQRVAMEQYKEILLKRLLDLRFQERLQHEQTCAPETEENEGRPVSSDPSEICCTSCKWGSQTSKEQPIQCTNPKADNKSCWEAKNGTPTD